MSPAGGDRSDTLIVARIRRPHGVRGELRIAIDTDRPGQVFRRGATLQLADVEGRGVGREVIVAGFRPTDPGAILKLEGVESREAADEFRGHSLLIAAESAAPASAGEVHYRDLIGLEAFVDDVRIGRVDDLLEIAGGVTLVVRTARGKELLVPFVKAMVADVDLDGRTVTLTLPDGLLEL